MSKTEGKDDEESMFLLKIKGRLPKMENKARVPERRKP
jgi:hypothetical protein